MKTTYHKSDAFIGRGLSAFSKKKELFESIQKSKGAHPKVVEIGCGKGKMLLELLAQFPQIELHGLNLAKEHGLKEEKDFETNAKEWGIKISPKSTLPRLHIGSVTKLPFANDSLDIVISQVTFLHVKNKALGITEVCRTLKPGGIAIIAIGPYSIRRKRGHAMPAFYKNLRNKLGEDINPRFLVRKDGKFISFPASVNLMKNETADIKLSSVKFTSETQRAKGYWLFIEKKKSGTVHLPFTYKSKESEKLTELYAKKNPVNWGVIDIYDI